MQISVPCRAPAPDALHLWRVFIDIVKGISATGSTVCMHAGGPLSGFLLEETGCRNSTSSSAVLRRMLWTMDTDKNAMRAYLRASGSETGRTGYGTVMYRNFQRRKPTLTITEQNLAVYTALRAF